MKKETPKSLKHRKVKYLLYKLVLESQIIIGVLWTREKL